ncbi:MAG TPA: hypothetical protein VKJ07_05195, partial [Mycobacteriales bacterium]|nr:hypothetical protein [Mycobacteriales bacterium]
PGWFPLGPVPGALLAAGAADRGGQVVATVVIRMQHCPGLVDEHDAEAVLAAVPDSADDRSVREARFCAPECIAVLAACAAPGAPVTADDLASALRQIAVYAVDSTGVAISPSSPDVTNAGLAGSTRTV